MADVPDKDERELTPAQREEIRSFLISLVVPAGAVLSIISVLGGFVINEWLGNKAALSGINNSIEANKDILKNLQNLTVQVATSAANASSSVIKVEAAEKKMNEAGERVERLAKASEERLEIISANLRRNVALTNRQYDDIVDTLLNNKDLGDVKSRLLAAGDSAVKEFSTRLSAIDGSPDGKINQLESNLIRTQSELAALSRFVDQFLSGVRNPRRYSVSCQPNQPGGCVAQCKESNEVAIGGYCVVPGDGSNFTGYTQNIGINGIKSYECGYGDLPGSRRLGVRDAHVICIPVAIR